MQKKMIWLAVLIAVVLVAAGVVIAMQGSDNKQSPTQNTPTNTPATNTNSSSSTSATNSVSINNFAFSPASITVKKGTKVTWTNKDSTSHTVTADSSSGPKSSLLGQGESYSFTFDTVGTFSYHCQVHSTMTGTVTVTE